MTRSTDPLATLRTLDPADPDVDPQDARARAALERILNTDPGRHGAGGTPARAGSRRGRRVVAAACATAVTAGAAFVIIPSLTGGDHAFASWTATPSGMSAQAAADAASNCRSAQLDGPGEEYSDHLRAADLAIAERRGKWTLVTLVGTDGFSALCITDESTPLFRSWIGSLGPPGSQPTPGPRDVVATSLGMGMVGGELSVAEGYVGSDVAGVVYRSPAHGEVEATVSGGRFAFWLPGGELEGASSTGVEVDVTFQDGSTATQRIDMIR